MNLSYAGKEVMADDNRAFVKFTLLFRMNKGKKNLGQRSFAFNYTRAYYVTIKVHVESGESRFTNGFQRISFSNKSMPKTDVTE